MPDAGDSATATLTVTPHDGTTQATLTVTAPDGTTTQPTTASSDSGHTWTAIVDYTMPGVWRLSWTVTGTGEGVEHQLVAVAPTPGTAGGQRIYATSADLATYLQAAPPLDADRLLREASKALDDALTTAVYDTDDDGMPTDSAVRAAFRDAVCAIVQWWGETGDEMGAGGAWTSVSAGPVSLSRGGATPLTEPVAGGNLPPRAWAELKRLPIEVCQLGVVTSP